MTVVVIQYYQETQTSENDQKAGGKVQKDIRLIGNHVSESAENIKAGIIKCGNGVENTGTNGPWQRIILNENNKAQHCAGKFKAKGHKKHRFYQAYDSFYSSYIQPLLGKKTSLYSNVLSHCQNQAYTYGSDSQASDLNEKSYNTLAKRRKMIRSVYGDQACDTYGAGRSKQGVNEADLCIRFHGDWKQQQERTKQDCCGKAKGDQPSCGLPFKKVNDAVHEISAVCCGK